MDYEYNDELKKKIKSIISLFNDRMKELSKALIEEKIFSTADSNSMTIGELKKIEITVLNNKCFVSSIDIGKLASLIINSTNNTIEEIRHIFFIIYGSFTNIKDYYSSDKESLIQLSDLIKSHLPSEQAHKKNIVIMVYK